MSKRDIGFFQLTALGFFCVGGSVAGIESAVHAVGPLLTILLVLIVCLTYSLPTIYMSSSMSIEFDDLDKGAGGPVRFAQNLNPYFTFVNAFIELFSTFAEMMTYIRLISVYTKIPYIEFGITVFLGVLNLCNTSHISNIMIVLFVYVMINSIYFLCIPHDGINTIDYKHDLGDFDLRFAFLIVLCNMNGFDNITAFIHKTIDPNINIPCAQLCVLAISILLYTFMIISTYANVHDSKLWVNGIFMHPLQTHHDYLKNTFLVSILLSCFASAYCLMSFIIEMLVGIREMKYIPSLFNYKYYRVIFITICMLGCCFMHYQYLAELSAVFGSVAMLIQSFAWYKIENHNPSCSTRYKHVCIFSLIIVSIFSMCSLDLFSLYASSSSFVILSFIYLLYTYFSNNHSNDLSTIFEKIQRNRKQEHNITNRTNKGGYNNKCEYHIINTSENQK